MLDAEVDRSREALRVNAVHEFLPWEPEEHDMVRAEIAELGEWWDEAFRHRTGGIDRLLLGAPGAPDPTAAAAAGRRGEVAVHELSRVRPGAGPDYLAALLEGWAPVAADHGLHLVGAYDVVMTDVDPAAVERVQARYPQVKAVPDTATLVRTPHDVYSHNALGGALDAQTVEALPARIVCGGANNQLATAEMGDRLVERGILYAPDYLVNAGGVIQVEDERHGFSFDRAKAKADGIFDVALRVFRTADSEGVSPAVAADRLAEERIRAVGRLSTIRLPR